MTDREKLLSLLREWDVPFTDDKDGVAVGWGGRDSDKIVGYLGFYTLFEFDDSGKFLRMGAWE